MPNLAVPRVAVYRYRCVICGKRRLTRVYARAIAAKCWAQGCAPRHLPPENQMRLFPVSQLEVHAEVDALIEQGPPEPSLPTAERRAKLREGLEIVRNRRSSTPA